MTMGFRNFFSVCRRLLLLLFVSTVLASDCPAGLVQHGNGTSTVCCHPVFNCGPGKEVKLCTTDLGQDECVPCKDGYTSTSMVNSLSPSPSQCFMEDRRHLLCPLDDTVANDHSTSSTCMLLCRCNNDFCFYGNDPCNCNYRGDVCDVNTYMDPMSGDCEPCPKFTYTSKKGCGMCIWNETAWMLEQGAVSGPDPVDTKTNVAKNDSATMEPVVTEHKGYVIEVDESTQPTPAAQAEDTDGVSIAAVVIILVLLVIIGVIVAIVLYSYRRIQKNDEKSRIVRFYRRLVPQKDTNTVILDDVDPEAGESAPAPSERPQQAVAPITRSDPSPTHGETDTAIVDQSDDVNATPATHLLEGASCETDGTDQKTT